MSLSTIILSVTLMVLFVPGSTDLLSQDVFALKGQGVPILSYGSSSDVCGDKLCSEIDNDMKSVSSESMKKVETIENIPVVIENISDDIAMKTQTSQTDGVGIEFSVPETIIAKQLTPVNARIFDTSLDANLSHNDWSYAVTNSNGDIIHKSTTLHGHFGVMNFKEYFPESGTYTIKYSMSSFGLFMLGQPIPEGAQTRSVVTGDLSKFTEDPKNNFGSRAFEFTVDVIDPEQTVLLEGSEPNTAYLIKLTTQPKRIVAGEPVTIILDVDDYDTGKDATHIDGLISVIPQHYYQSSSGDQPDAPIPLHGAYHSHTGVLSLTQIFPKSGTILLEIDLSTLEISVPLFGQGSTQFTLQVFDSADTSTAVMKKDTKENTVGIVGLESPFYMPNTITVSAGDTILFDNVDASHHTVTSVKSGTTDPDGKFDSGLLNVGEVYELVLTEEGTYDYFCALHTGMKGTIMVS